MNPEANRFRYEYMRLDTIKAVLKRYPLVIQPTGLLEWHGAQNAVGLDGLLAYYICERAIQRLGDGVLMPLNWVGTYGFRRYEGTVCFDEATARAVFEQMFRELLKIGFKEIAIISGHGGHWQETALRSACKNIEKVARQQNNDSRLLALTYPAFAPQVKMGAHAMEGETSMLWRFGQAIGIDLIDPSQFHSGTERLLIYSLPKGEKIPLEESSEWKWQETLRDPSACSPERGEELISAYAEGIALELEEIMREMGFNVSGLNK